jgi:murein DD-endopeptidase MepM/ murein hydrolase activator NlpD
MGWLRMGLCAEVKKVVAISFSLVVLLMGNVSVHCDDGGNDEARKKLQDEMTKVQERHSKVKKQISDAEQKKRKKISIKNNLDNQVTETKKEISALNKKITNLDYDIMKKEKEIAEKEEEIKVNYNRLKDRLRASYMAPKSSQLGVIMGIDSFSEFLSRAEMNSRITTHDKEFVDKLNDQMKFIQIAKNEIKRNKNQIEMNKGKVEQKKQVLNSQLEQVGQEVYSIEKEEQAYLKDAANLKKKMDELQAEISRLCQSMGDDSPFVGGEFTWPVPGYYKISSPYGPRSFDGFHTGVDIAGGGIYGKNIVAANDGEVKFVDSCGRGLYGRYLIIDHGGGYRTLYAHASSINVSVGQTVKKGQPIAAVGSTGNSTGPHLHFEVRIGGKHRNPMAYFNKR